MACVLKLTFWEPESGLCVTWLVQHHGERRTLAFAVSAILAGHPSGTAL